MTALQTFVLVIMLISSMIAPADYAQIQETVPVLPETQMTADEILAVANELVAKYADAPSYESFNPAAEEWDWDALQEATQPTFEEFLEVHGLTADDIQEFTPTEYPWEPAQYIIELTKENYDATEIPLLEGYQYTVSTTDDRVTVFWGGDPEIETVPLKYGFTARWVPSYTDMPYAWLSIEDPRELLVREYRFGRYARSDEANQWFDRSGAYYTGTGNVESFGWVPPALDIVVPASYLDAAAIYGGRAVESEWTHNANMTAWSWKYGEKVAGSADYCPTGAPCWQTTYVPDGTEMDLWLSPGAIGPDGKAVSEAGAYTFVGSEEVRAILMDGTHNVDEFSIRAE